MGNTIDSLMSFHVYKVYLYFVNYLSHRNVNILCSCDYNHFMNNDHLMITNNRLFAMLAMWHKFVNYLLNEH